MLRIFEYHLYLTNRTGPFKPLGKGFQCRASKTPFNRFSFRLADMLML
jgi:hypothetical protein